MVETTTGILLDYQLIFMLLSFIMFFIAIFLIFIKPTTEKIIAAILFILFDIIIAFVCLFSMNSINIVGYNTNGTISLNRIVDFMGFNQIYLVIAYLDMMLFLYCGYLLIKKPWEENKSAEDEERDSYSAF